MPVAIVTGSDSGIGKASAVQPARDGFGVGITWHRDRAGAEEAAEEVRRHGRRAEVRQLDLGDLPGAAREIASCIGWRCSEGAAWTTGADGRTAPPISRSPAPEPVQNASWTGILCDVAREADRGVRRLRLPRRRVRPRWAHALASID